MEKRSVRTFDQYIFFMEDPVIFSESFLELHIFLKIQTNQPTHEITSPRMYPFSWIHENWAPRK